MWFYSSCFFFQLFSLYIILTCFTQNKGQWFSYVVKDQLYFYFLCDFSPSSLSSFIVSFNFLHISTAFQLYNYSLLHKLLLKFPFYPLVFFRICPLKSFWFCKDCCYLLGTPFSYDMNTFNGSSSLLFCSELWVWKIFLIVLLITFNGFQFNCMIFLIYDISLFNHVWSLQIKFTLLTRVLIVDNFTCSSWFDKKWV